jgi:hypothetical protein
MRTVSAIVFCVVLGCLGCQPSPSLEEQCVRAKQAQADAFRTYEISDCRAGGGCQTAQLEVVEAAQKWSAKVCK